MRKLLVLLLALVLLAPASSQQKLGGKGKIRRGSMGPPSGWPALPQSEPDESMPDLTGARTITVKNAAGDYTPSQLDTALADANTDRETNDRVNIVQIDADVDVTFATARTIPVGENDNSKWIIVRTANHASLPALGTRVVPATHATHMPKIRVSGANEPAIKTAEYTGGKKANYWRFVGIEFTTTNSTTTPIALVMLGSSIETTLAEQAERFGIDRCYIHGKAATDTLSRAIGLHPTWGFVVDSYVDDVHNSGADSQAIIMGNGPGPYLIQNNFLEASGEVTMIGGFDPSIAGMNTSDVTFRRNFYTKDLRYKTDEEQYAGVGAGHKNLFELKVGKRILVEGNWFQYSWVDGQTGWGIVLTPRNQDGTNPTAEISDVTIQHNVMTDVNRAFDFLSIDDLQVTAPLLRVKVHNNLFVSLDGQRWGEAGGAERGDLFIVISGDDLDEGPNDFIITHNTAFPEAALATAGFFGATGWTVKDNMFARGAYGWRSDTASEGNAALAEYVGIVFTKNVLIGATAATYNNYAGNFFPATAGDVGFTDYAGNDFSLAGASSYDDAASDGTAIGVNFTLLEAALGIDVTPLPDYVPPWITGVAADPADTTAQIVVTASSEACDIYVEYGTTTSYGTAAATQAATLGQTKTFNISSLSTGTLYHYRVRATDAAGNTVTGRDRTFTTD